MKPVNSNYQWYEKSSLSPFPFVLCGGCYKLKHNVTYAQCYFTSKQPYYIKHLQDLSLSDGTMINNGQDVSYHIFAFFRALK